MNRLARFVILFAVLALASACGARQFATGYPKDELVLSRLGNTVNVIYNGETVQRVEVRGDFKFNMEIPNKARNGHGSTLRYLESGDKKILGVFSGTMSSYESVCDTGRVIHCSTVDYLGVDIPYALSFYGDSADVVISLIGAEHHMLRIIYRESITTPAKDSPDFESFCNGILARALATFKVDVPALRMHMAPAKPTV